MESNKRTVFLRKENKSIWERRVGLVPKDCKTLISKGIRIKVEPSELRCYSDEQYKAVGCEISEDATDADLIIGIKEVPLEYLYEGKTYLYYSHTIKGQPDNMPALKKCLDKKIRLMDYELIRENSSNNPKNIVSSSRFAGLAGAMSFIQGLGEFLLHKKVSTPFLFNGFSYMYPTVDEAKASVRNVGSMIKKNLLPKEICPFIVGFTSNGAVSQGAQEIFQNLPHEYIDADNLDSLFINNGKEPRRDIVYLTKIEIKNMYIHKKNRFNYTEEDFFKNPEQFDSVFADKFLPRLSLIIHCMFWNNTHPKLITKDKAKEMCLNKKWRPFGICDVTCDLHGSIELLQKFTTIDNRFYNIDPITNAINMRYKNMTNSSILYQAVDYLPSEFSLDTSNYFSEKLTPFVPGIVNSNYPSEFNERTETMPIEVLNACETWNGKLMPRFEYLYGELAKFYPKF